MTMQEGGTVQEPSARTRTLTDHGMPAHLRYWGIAVGLFLTGLGAALIILFGHSVPQALSALTTCVGFGIVLAAFGSAAEGKWGGFAVVGAAALAIVLFLLLQKYIPGAAFKRGQIAGDFTKVADFRIVDEDPLYTRRDRNTGAIRFIVLNKKFESSRVSILVDTTEKGDGREFFQMVASSDKIAKRYLADTPGVISWTFDYANRVVKDGREVVFSSPEELDEQLLRDSRTSKLLFQGIDVVSMARAAEPARVDVLLTQLKDDDTAVRRNAREGLIAVGPTATGQMMKALRESASDYRTRLGVTYSLAGMLRKNPQSSSDIMRQLTPDDLQILQSITADRDPTVRFQATEFLYRLGDARSVDPAIKAVTSTDPTSAPNSALILKGVYPKLTPAEQRRISTELEPSRAPLDSKSRAIIDSLKN